MRRRLSALVLAAALAPTSVAAHEYWLAPSRDAAVAGDSIMLRACSGMGFRGEPRPWSRARGLRLEARGAAVLDLKPLAHEGDETWARFVAGDAGGTSIAYQGDFAFIELPAAEFEDYLRLEGLDGPLASRAAAGRSDQPGRERYARCCRAWVAGTDPARVTSPAGLTLEIVPEADPARVARTPFRVLLRGEPLAHQLVRGWRRPLDARGLPLPVATRDSVPPVFEARTDGHGRIVLPTAPGEWLVSTVYMEPAGDGASVDWQSWWASFTFASPARRRSR